MLNALPVLFAVALALAGQDPAPPAEPPPAAPPEIPAADPAQPVADESPPAAPAEAIPEAPTPAPTPESMEAPAAQAPPSNALLFGVVDGIGFEAGGQLTGGLVAPKSDPSRTFAAPQPYVFGVWMGGNGGYFAGDFGLMGLITSSVIPGFGKQSKLLSDLAGPAPFEDKSQAVVNLHYMRLRAGVNAIELSKQAGFGGALALDLGGQALVPRDADGNWLSPGSALTGGTYLGAGIGLTGGVCPFDDVCVVATPIYQLLVSGGAENGIAGHALITDVDLIFNIVPHLLSLHGQGTYELEVYFDGGGSRGPASEGTFHIFTGRVNVVLHIDMIGSALGSLLP